MSFYLKNTSIEWTFLQIFHPYIYILYALPLVWLLVTVASVVSSRHWKSLWRMWRQCGAGSSTCTKTPIEATWILFSFSLLKRHQRPPRVECCTRYCNPYIHVALWWCLSIGAAPKNSFPMEHDGVKSCLARGSCFEPNDAYFFTQHKNVFFYREEGVLIGLWHAYIFCLVTDFVHMFGRMRCIKCM